MRFIFILLTCLIITSPVESYSEIQQDVSNLSNYVTSWSTDSTTFGLTMKLESSNKDLKSYKSDLKQKIEGNDHHKHSLINESLSVVELTPTRSQLIYQVTTNEWNPEIHQNVQDLLKNRNLSRFLENGTLFTFFQASFDSKLDKNLFLDQVKEDLQIEVKTEMKEELLTVISGFTPKLKQRIPHKEEDINIQLAIREEDDRKNTVTIGTPILIIEY